MVADLRRVVISAFIYSFKNPKRLGKYKNLCISPVIIYALQINFLNIGLWVFSLLGIDTTHSTKELLSVF